MKTHRRRERAVAIGLAAVAGYVDALGFLALGGTFIAFMSGNTTRLGVGLGVGLHGSFDGAAGPAAVLGLFVLGVLVGSLINERFPALRRSGVLALVTGLLALGAVAVELGWFLAAIAFMATAMGAVNTVFERNGEVSLGISYMTGTLVKLGQRLTAALLGRDRWGWLGYALLWAALLGGTILGSLAYRAEGLGSLKWAAAATGLTTLAVWRWLRVPESV